NQMDRSPASSDGPDSAASVEPYPARRKPCDNGDDDISRKRRRTSHSASPSRSHQSYASDSHTSSSVVIDQSEPTPEAQSIDTDLIDGTTKDHITTLNIHDNETPAPQDPTETFPFYDSRSEAPSAPLSRIIQYVHGLAITVGLDYEALHRYRTWVSLLEEPQPPHLISAPYLNIIGGLSRREHLRSYNAASPGSEPSSDSTDDIGVFLNAFQSAPEGNISYLLKLVQAQIALASRYPQMVETVLHPTAVAAGLLRETSRILQADGPPQAVAQAKARLAVGYQFFSAVSDSLSTAIDKHVTHLSSDGTQCLIAALLDILRISLGGDHKQAVDRLKTHRETHTALPPHLTPDVISWEWRLDILTRLIMSSQMQLRVMAVSQTCAELITLWKRFTDEPNGGHVLNHVAEIILGARLVEYILGPTCHPEITGESGNIVGFLVVTKRYSRDHTDLLWRTMATAQNPRVSEALLRMSAVVIGLFGKEELLYLCGKFLDLPINELTPPFRLLFDTAVKQYMKAFHTDIGASDLLLHRLCMRLVRVSSAVGTDRQFVYPEIHQVAIARLREVVAHGLDHQVRQDLYAECARDISTHSDTALGSLWCIWAIAWTSPSLESRRLVEEHDLARILVQNLEHTLRRKADTAVPTAIFYGPPNTPRRDFVLNILLHAADTVTTELGLRLWNLMVGPLAPSRSDRDAGWLILNNITARGEIANHFPSVCFSEYLPQLPRDCLCAGALQFLWRMVLSAVEPDLVTAMIQTLAKDVYVESKSILEYPYSRARQIHSRLVNRCLEQMDAAAEKLGTRDDNHSAAEADGEAMDVVSSEEQQHTFEHERAFRRSLAVLQEFLKAYQAKAQFATPDLRSLMLQSSNEVQGEPANLKYQSFDANLRADILPLDIGLQNSAASLLAALREATGFGNFRVYYKGKPFAPEEDEISKSLGELGIHEGLLLVKKETSSTASSVRIRPGSSPLEIDILGHFDQLWRYLSLPEPMAGEVYNFLISLPADSRMLEAIHSESTPCAEIFPERQPYRALYAAHAIQEYLDSARRQGKTYYSVGEGDDVTSGQKAHVVLNARVHSLLIKAISDLQVFDACTEGGIQGRLCSSLIGLYLRSSNEMATLQGAYGDSLDTPPVDRLVSLLLKTSQSPRNGLSARLISETFSAIMLSSGKLSRRTPEARHLIETLLLMEPVESIRKDTAEAIEFRMTNPHSRAVSSASFSGFFWPILSGMILKAVSHPDKCEEFFDLSVSVQIGLPLVEDIVTRGLLGLILPCLSNVGAAVTTDWLPEQWVKQPVPHSILSSTTREMLCDVLFDLSMLHEPSQLQLLEQMNKVVPFDTKHAEQPYDYALPVSFDRMQAIRSTCGYSGLRNLSNTCYLNSLFTQLFMNVNFRQFVLGAEVRDGKAQELLVEAQKVFAHLQDSLHRFIDPTTLVSSIKSYEGGMIDIHNQMDADEFFNMLFDQWEGHFASAEDREKFKSFYSGQLVQQVRSKECEHVSEVTEAFSAIQCDIKGKRSLVESLTDYVGGELLQGADKYKCGTCDRRVDAVKRSSLKEIPDHLIFHLKRFDFEIRTLMRNKIHDYFSFPTKLDMRPYMYDHLGQPSPPGEEDMFELVGVLVHAGTAESGHYYSYIRERPTTAGPESWVEFNDDQVTPWDPSELEKSTFGSDTHHNHGPEKPYSAYMLFYQRSAALKADQQLLERAGTSPRAKAKLPLDISECILNENTTLLRRHCLFDPGHAVFALRLFERFTLINKGCSLPDQSKSAAAMKMLLGHFDQVVTRTRGLPQLEEFAAALEHSFRRWPDGAVAFINYLSSRSPVFIQFAQRIGDGAVRARFMDIFMGALKEIRQHRPAVYGLTLKADKLGDLDSTVAGKAVLLLQKLWVNIHIYLRAWSDTFSIMLKFAELGVFETALLVDNGILARLLRLIAADPTVEDFQDSLMRLLSTVMQRVATRPPSFSMAISLLDHLMGYMFPCLDGNTRTYTYDRMTLFLADPTQPLAWSEDEIEVLYLEDRDLPGSIFVRRLLELGESPEATDSIISRLADWDSAMRDSIWRAFENMVSGKMEAYSMVPFLRAGLILFRKYPGTDLARHVLRHAARSCAMIENMDGRAFLQFFKSAIDSTLAQAEPPQGPSSSPLLLHIHFLPLWTPGLLGYFERNTSQEAAQFAMDFLCSFESTLEEDDLTGKVAVVKAGRELGARCLKYLQKFCLNGRRQVVRSSIEDLQAVANHCERYFLSDVQVGGSYTLEEFQSLRDVVMDAVQQRVVDELEDDGSNMSLMSCFSDSDTIES
ncbi:hypothetical protein ACRALDRAFT_1044844, partial [Sodiomyces alcalophilus JCM 7366]|uniref:uncharacterized protein n=1 Tax=Sodiomyces alcalophilus JCM 7366 TaxID=591952 RepID=UPI0039B6269A